MNSTLPRLIPVRQKFPPSLPIDIQSSLRDQFEFVRRSLKPGASVAVAVGSRGITGLSRVVGAVIEQLTKAGAQPFIVPAMGSHGGATPDGQIEILSEYGVTEKAMGVPIRASLDVQKIGTTEDGVDVFFSSEALKADGVIVINRVKPHTDFSSDTLGSGILKMLVIGLGKREGAANFHAATTRFGYERVIRTAARLALQNTPILCGVALVENQLHDTDTLAVLPREEIESKEAELFVRSKKLLPRLPFDEMDLLIVDQLGKNISGAGMDPNVTGRSVEGPSTKLGGKDAGPVIRRLFVRDLTPETHGNAVGLGLADFATTRLVKGMDRNSTYINSLTALKPQTAKIPIHFDTDREVIERALASLALADFRTARIVRIANTLSLEKLEVSENYAEAIRAREDLEASDVAAEMRFDPEGNLFPLV